MIGVRGVIVAMVISAAPFAASAQMLDMSTVTCGNVAEMSDEDAAFFFTWLHGYHGGQSGDTTLDMETLEPAAESIGSVCEENPELSVMNAVERALEE